MYKNKCYTQYERECAVHLGPSNVRYVALHVIRSVIIGSRILAMARCTTGWFVQAHRARAHDERARGHLYRYRDRRACSSEYSTRDAQWRYDPCVRISHHAASAAPRSPSIAPTGGGAWEWQGSAVLRATRGCARALRRLLLHRRRRRPAPSGRLACAPSHGGVPSAPLVSSSFDAGR